MIRITAHTASLLAAADDVKAFYILNRYYEALHTLPSHVWVEIWYRADGDFYLLKAIED